MLVHSLLVLLGLLTTSSFAKPIISNAERIQRGEPLNKPARLYNGTKIGGLRPRASPAPDTTIHNAMIEISKGGTVIGYGALGPNAVLVPTPLKTDALTFDLPNAGPSTLNNVILTNGVYSGKYLGAFALFPNIADASDTTSTKQSNMQIGMMTQLIQPPGQYAATDADGHSDTGIWTITEFPGPATVTWINRGGKPVVPNCYELYGTGYYETHVNGKIWCAGRASDIGGNTDGSGTWGATEADKVSLRWISM